MISIGAVARQTGLDISTLRKWESRYGFPMPLRRDSGQRVYRDEDVAALQTILRRLATGERVSKVIAELHLTQSAVAPRSQLKPLPAVARSTPKPAIAAALAAIHAGKLPALLTQLSNERYTPAGRSLRDYIENFAAPLSIAVGEAWASGQLPIHAEHLFSATMETLLITEISRFPLTTAPVVLLVTAAGEKHTLGLAMTHAVLAEAGVPCLRLCSDLPVAEVVAVCRTHQFAAVGVSASAHYAPRILAVQLAELRRQLPADVELWLGGGGINRLSTLPADSKTFPSFAALLESARPLCVAPAHPDQRPT